MSDIELIRRKFELLRPTMNNGMCRLWAACEAKVLGSQGETIVVAATGLSIETIRQGLKDLEQFSVSSSSKVFTPQMPQGRIRRLGGGRKRAEVKEPSIISALEVLVENDIAGDPMSQQKWLRNSLGNLSKQLKEQGYQASKTVVSRLLKEKGFSMKANSKRKIHSKSPGRNEQFNYIALQRQIFTDAGLPNISVDSKKKELIGNFSNPGKTWRRQSEQVNQNDYPSAASCRATPYGVYDMKKNIGSVFVGTSNNTSKFAVDSISRWWRNEGIQGYSNKNQLLILADGGGSNGWKSRSWKKNIQDELCNRLNLIVTVCHYPTGCSKWNPIEHRLFSQISINWAGKPLRTLDIMLGYIRGTTTKTGLTVKAYLQDGVYEKGQRVTKEEFEQLNIAAHTTLPDWNYTISPQ